MQAQQVAADDMVGTAFIRPVSSRPLPITPDVRCTIEIDRASACQAACRSAGHGAGAIVLELDCKAPCNSELLPAGNALDEWHASICLLQLMPQWQPLCFRLQSSEAAAVMRGPSCCGLHSTALPTPLHAGLHPSLGRDAQFRLCHLLPVAPGPCQMLGRVVAPAEGSQLNL